MPDILETDDLSSLLCAVRVNGASSTVRAQLVAELKGRIPVALTNSWWCRGI